MRKNKGIRSMQCVTALVLALAVAGCGAAGTYSTCAPQLVQNFCPSSSLLPQLLQNAISICPFCL